MNHQTSTCGEHSDQKEGTLSVVAVLALQSGLLILLQYRWILMLGISQLSQLSQLPITENMLHATL